VVGQLPAVLERPLGQVLADVEVSDEQGSLGDQSVALGTQERVEGVVWSRGTTVMERAA
jgi:hypothetical protein